MLPLWRDAQIAFCRCPHQLTGSPCVRQAKDIWTFVLQYHIFVSGRPPTPSDDELPIRFVVIKLNPPSHLVSHYLTAIINYTHNRGHLTTFSRPIDWPGPIMESQSTAGFSGRQLLADALPQALHTRYYYSFQASRKGVEIQARLFKPLPKVQPGNARDTTLRLLYMQAVSTGAGTGLFKKLGRVLREKAAGDLERVFKGTSKTRERLGVRGLFPWSAV